MDEELKQKVEELSAKVDEMYKLAMTLKKMYMWNIILSIAFVVVPLIIAALLLPWMIHTVSNAYSGLL